MIELDASDTPLPTASLFEVTADGAAVERTFIPRGVVPDVLVLKPDFPESKEDWPFLWAENEYEIDISANYILLAHMANDLVGK